MRGRILVVGFLALALGGCAAGENTYPGVEAAGMPNVQLALNHAILRTDEAVAQLDGQLIGPAEAASLPEVLPGELEKPVSWSYRGELTPGVKLLAKAVGYQVQVIRPPHSLPVQVSVSIANRPIMDAFKALSAAAGAAATVSVHPDRHLVEVEYAARPTTRA